MANRWGNNVNSERLYLGGPKSPQMVTAVMKLKDAAPWKKSYDQPRCMACHSSTLAWKIPWTEEPGRLQSHGVSKSWIRLSDFTFTHWRRKWQPTPLFLPGDSQGRESLVGCRLWGCTESDRTEAT